MSMPKAINLTYLWYGSPYRCIGGFFIKNTKSNKPIATKFLLQDCQQQNQHHPSNGWFAQGYKPLWEDMGGHGGRTWEGHGDRFFVPIFIKSIT